MRRTKEHMAIRKENGAEDRYAKGIHFDIRTEGCCYVTMHTNAGPLEVYIDSMDGLTDPPMVRASIPGRRDKEINLKMSKIKTTGYGWGKAYHENDLKDLPLSYIKKVEAFLREMKMTLAEPFEKRRLDGGTKND